ncbi:MAG: type IV toxin-antitoxin system AbiEi family antitoxin domain-containing protein [Micromonosporaceae bacterium]
MVERREEIAARQGGVLLRQQVIDSGMSEAAFRRRQRSGQWRRLRRAVYAEGEFADFVSGDSPRSHALDAAAAISQLTDAAAVSFESAALLWGVETLGRRWQREIQLTRPRRSEGLRRYPGVVVHQAALPAEHLTRRWDVAITTVARTVIDIARTRSFRAAVVAADAALRKGLCSRDELTKTAAACSRWPGIRRARAVAAFADPRSESPLESLSRASFHLQGLPPPAIQEWITQYDRVDFLWKVGRVIGEADGRQKYATRDDLLHEKDREDHLTRMGYKVVRWSWHDIYHRPDAVTTWIQAALTR